MAESLIKASHLGCKSGQRHLLHDINWQVQKGEHWAIFGLNGSGKTTLLSVIAGYKAFTEGSLEVFGQSYTNENILDIRRRIGWVSSAFFDQYLFKETALYVVLSGLFGTLSIQFDIKNEDIQRAKMLLTELRMKSKINVPFNLLSKGERQNVLIARALIARPDILVLDEPGTGLDVYAREYMLNTVRDLAEGDDVTLLYVTHYPEEIQPQFSKCLLLRHGRVYAQGDTKAVVTSERMSALVDEPVKVLWDDDGIRMRLTAPSSMRTLCYGAERGGE